VSTTWTTLHDLRYLLLAHIRVHGPVGFRPLWTAALEAISPAARRTHADARGVPCVAIVVADEIRALVESGAVVRAKGGLVAAREDEELAGTATETRLGRPDTGPGPRRSVG